MNDNGTTDEDVAIASIDVLSNDAELDSTDVLTVTSIDGTSINVGSPVTLASGATVGLNGDGTLSYDPALNFNGADSFVYTVSDGTATDTAVVSITVDSVNNAPVTTPDTYSVSEDGTLGVSATLGVLSNDSDAHDGAPGENNTPLTAKLIDSPTNGSLVVFNPNGAFLYQPNADFFGTDTFTYTATDSLNGTSVLETVTITVTEVNDAPAAVADGTSVDEDGSVIIDVLTNDSTGPSNEGDQTLSVIGTSAPSNGNVTINPNGTITYTPFENFNGTDSFTYTIQDNGTTNGAATPLTATALVSITVNAVDDPAVVAGTVTGAVSEGDIGDAPVTASGAITISDVDEGDMPTFADVTSTAGDNAYGSFELVSGTWTYTLNQSAVQDLDAGDMVNDTITFTASDGTTQEITVTITGTDDAAVVAGTFTGAVTEGDMDDAAVTATGAIAISDVDEDDMPSFANVASTLSDSAFGSFELVSGTWTFTLDQNSVQEFAEGDMVDDTITFTATDGTMQEITVTITGTNDAPAASSVAGAADEDGPAVTVSADFTDADVGDTFTFAVDTTGTLGSVTNNGDGTFNYDPNGQFEGLAVGATASDTFTYTVTDNNGGMSTETVTITLTGQNDSPVIANAIADVTATEDDTDVTIDLSGVFSDVDGDTLSYTAVSADGTLVTATVSGSDLVLDFQDDANGSTTVTVTADDGNGGTVSDTFNVTVDPVNDSPVVANAIADVTATEDDTDVTIDLSGVFSDVDGDTLSYTAVSADGTLVTATVSGSDLVLDFQDDANGSTTVTVTADDGNGGTVSDTFNVTVDPVNDSPVVANAIADVTATEDDTDVTIDLSGVFSDVDGDTLSYTAVSADGTLVTATVSGSDLVLDFQDDANGSTTVTVTADDGNGGTVSDTFNVTVDPVNDSPVVANAIADVTATEDDTDVTIDLSGVFSDVDGDTLSYTAVSADGTLVTATVSGSDLVLDFQDDANGSTTVTVTADDGNGGTVSDTFNVTVDPVNDSPVVANAIADVTATEDDTDVTIDLSGVFSDVDGDTLSYTAVSADGTLVTATVSGSDLVLDFQDDANGSTTVTVTADDGNGGTVSDTFNVTVDPVNDSPVVANAIADVTATEDDTDVTIDLSGVFSDVDGDTLSYTAVSADGTLVTATVSGSDLVLDFQDDANGSTTVTVTADDGNGGTVSDTFNVTVDPVNDSPVVANAIADVTATEDDTDVTIDLSGVFSDVDGDTLSYTAVSADGTLVTATVSGSDLVLDFQDDANGSTTVTVTADDGNGGTVSDTFNVTVDPVNDSPVVANAIADVTATEDDTDVTIDLSGVFSDVDGDTLSYTAVSADGTLVTATVSGSDLVLDFQDDANGSTTVTVTADDGNGGTVSDTFNVTVDPVVASVAGRHIFYDNSGFDENLAGAGSSDDGAIAPSPSDLSIAGGDTSLGKEALLPGNTATFQNYTSFVRGINGIIVDIDDLAATPTLATIGDFFEFRVGNSNDFVSGFSTAPIPIEIAVRGGDGDGGSDRVTIVWADNAIENQWLEVTVLANASTGLVTEDIHYWGNIIGEVGNQSGNTLVNATDQGQTRDNFTQIFQAEAIEGTYDFNRDGLVNATDQAIARDNFTPLFGDVQLISPSAPPQALTSKSFSGFVASSVPQPLMTNTEVSDQRLSSSSDQPAELAVLLGVEADQSTALEDDSSTKRPAEDTVSAKDSVGVLDEAFSEEQEFWDIF